MTPCYIVTVLIGAHFGRMIARKAQTLGDPALPFCTHSGIDSVFSGIVLHSEMPVELDSISKC